MSAVKTARKNEMYRCSTKALISHRSVSHEKVVYILWYVGITPCRVGTISLWWISSLPGDTGI